MIDYYAILGVSPEAETEVISAAYKAMMRKYHPDVNKSAEAEAEAKKINEAYETLKDSARRAGYDLGRKKTTGQGSTSPPPPEPEGGQDWSNPFFTRERGALRVWAIYAAAFIAVALFQFGPNWIGASLKVGDFPFIADIAGVALVPFGIAYAGAHLWKALGAQDVEQKTHRLRWLWLQVPVLALMIYGLNQKEGRSYNSTDTSGDMAEDRRSVGENSTHQEEVEDAATISLAENIDATEGSMEQPTLDVVMPDGTVIYGVPEGTTQSELLGRLRASGRYDMEELLTPLQGPEAQTLRGGALPHRQGAPIFSSMENFRRQYPEYDDMSDVELAEALHRRFYPDLPIDRVYSALDITHSASDR